MAKKKTGFEPTPTVVFRSPGFTHILNRNCDPEEVEKVAVFQNWWEADDYIRRHRIGNHETDDCLKRCSLADWEEWVRETCQLKGGWIP